MLSLLRQADWKIKNIKNMDITNHLGYNRFSSMAQQNTYINPFKNSLHKENLDITNVGL